jgi:hypothetical protein
VGKEYLSPGRVECEPNNWAKDCFIPFNEHGGYVWCEQHFCYHWIDATVDKRNQGT